MLTKIADIMTLKKYTEFRVVVTETRYLFPCVFTKFRIFNGTFSVPGNYIRTDPIVERPSET